MHWAQTWAGCRGGVERAPGCASQGSRASVLLSSAGPVPPPLSDIITFTFRLQEGWVLLHRGACLQQRLS